VDVTRSIHDVLLEGRTRRDVAIVDMRARILRREPALDGAAVTCASAGAMDAIGLGFDLDEPSPVARVIVDLMGPRLGRPYFGAGNVISLKKTEIQPFKVVGVATRDYVEWEIEARAIVDGDETQITIDNNGEPFHITGRARPREAVGPGAGYGRYYEWVWYEQPQRLAISAQPPAQ